MVNILIKTDSHYRVNRKRIRNTIKDYLSAKKVKSAVEVSVSVVGDRMMRTLNRKYRSLDKTTDVLAFPLALSQDKEKAFINPPDDVLRLGDVVISYPQVLEGASRENKLVDDVIDELIIHGMGHLLGINQD